jgi:hypothetical protein
LSAYFVGDFVGKIKSLIGINVLGRGTVLIASGIYRQTQPISIPVCNEHYEQCQREGEQFSSPLEYTNGHNLSVYPCVMNIMNSASGKGNSSKNELECIKMSSMNTATNMSK